eukprot:gene15863-17461_t
MDVLLRYFLAFVFVGIFVLNCAEFTLQDETEEKQPTVLLAVIARNEEATLPIYFGYIESLNYPKKRISVFIQTDHNEDRTEQMLKQWMKHANQVYHDIKLISDPFEKFYNDSQGPNDWSPRRYHQLAKLRQNALDEARRQKVDYLLFADCDNFLMNPETLNALIAQKKLIVGPMLRVFHNETLFSNFWCGMNEQGYYKRTPEYMPILHRKKKGCFEVPMIHSTYLIDLRAEKTKQLKYDPPSEVYHGEIDDILILAHSARTSGIKMHVLNDVEYGRMMTAAPASTYHKPLVSSKLIYNRPPPVDNLGFDEIYMINLARRPDRRKKMLMSFEELGFLANEQDAVDGRKLSKEKITQMGIIPMRDFKDPYLERPITMGEVGCFMSHWNIWNEVVNNRLDTVLVLEDDIRFQPDFKRKLSNLVYEAKSLLPTVGWDLIYIGRKRMSDSAEHWVRDAETLVWAKYSYWTLAYILRLSGAQKLINGDPLKQLVPVDEYIPVMFNDHPDTELLNKFPVRDLVALSAHPLLVYPTHYIGDEGYISDTETTTTVFEDEAAVTNQTSNKTAKQEKEDSNKTAKQEKEDTKPVELENTNPDAVTQSNVHGEL